LQGGDEDRDDGLVVPAILSRKSKKSLRIHPHSLVASQAKGTHIRFDDDGEALEPLAFVAKKVGDRVDQNMEETVAKDYTLELQERVEEGDKEDKEMFRKRVRSKHRVERLGKDALVDEEEGLEGDNVGEQEEKEIRSKPGFDKEDPNDDEEEDEGEEADDDDDDEEIRGPRSKRRHLVEEDALHMLNGF
jgi:ATP-dependent RNA helicase DDX10/DBP4